MIVIEHVRKHKRWGVFVAAIAVGAAIAIAAGFSAFAEAGDTAWAATLTAGQQRVDASKSAAKIKTARTAHKGWLKVGKKTYYVLNKSGKVAKGWRTIAGKRYYFSPTTGVMKKGWLVVGGKRYYLNKKTGAMLRGWQTINKKKYYFDKTTGVAVSGELKVGNKRCIFLANGRLYKVWRKEIGHNEKRTAKRIIGYEVYQESGEGDFVEQVSTVEEAKARKKELTAAAALAAARAQLTDPDLPEEAKSALQDAIDYFVNKTKQKTTAVNNLNAATAVAKTVADGVRALEAAEAQLSDEYLAEDVKAALQQAIDEFNESEKSSEDIEKLVAATGSAKANAAAARAAIAAVGGEVAQVQEDGQDTVFEPVPAPEPATYAYRKLTETYSYVTWVVDKEAGYYVVVPDYKDGYRYHQRQGNGHNCGATSFAVAVNILLRNNKYMDNVAIWKSKAFGRDSTSGLEVKGTKWLEANGLYSKIAIERVAGDIHYASQMRAQLEQGRMVIISSGQAKSKGPGSIWQHADGSRTDAYAHSTGHWIVFYYYKNGVYYANDSSKDASVGGGCPYTEAQMQQWLDGRSYHGAQIVYLK